MNQGEKVAIPVSNGKVVGIITRHNVPNYGSILQSYATEEILRRLGFMPYTVDYLRSQEELPNLIRRYSEGRSAIHKLYRRIVWPILYELGQKRFTKERTALLDLSSHCNERTFWHSLPPTDIFLTGSDQVWNELGDGTVDKAFFWEGLKKENGQRVISYAASFGSETIVKGYENAIPRWLEKYDAISVREDSGVGLVERCGKHAVQVLDPTLLLCGDDWRKLARGAKTPKKPYALVYNLHPDSNMLEYVEEKTRETGIEVVSVCPTFRRRIGKQIILPTLAEFIALFQNAKCVYTDSFHGTSFCINLGTPFVAVFPKENSARNHSVLKLFGLEERAWDVFDGNAWDDDIDWTSVHNILETERSRSIAWLKNALEGSE